MPVKMFKITVALTLVMNELYRLNKEFARGFLQLTRINVLFWPIQ